MKIVTLATHDNERVECLFASARYHGVELVRLGQGRPFPAHGIKIVYLSELLRTLPEDELVVFVDGGDALWLRPADGLEEAFGACRAEVVFSVEQYFYFKARGKFSAWRRYPPGEPPLPHRRFLNAGMFAGRAGALLALFEATGVHARTPCDQTVFLRYLIDHPGSIALDHQQRLFCGTGGREGLEAEDYAIVDGVVSDRHTGTRPYAMHFPGKNFLGMDWVRGQLPFPGPRPALTSEDHSRYRNNLWRNRLGQRLGLDCYARGLLEDGAKYALGACAVAAAVAWAARR